MSAKLSVFFSISIFTLAIIQITINSHYFDLDKFNFESYKILVLFIEVIFILVFLINFNFTLIFNDEYYFSSGYLVKYLDIKKIELIKKTNTFEGTLFHCIVHLANGDKGLDKFFIDEYEFIKSKIIIL